MAERKETSNFQIDAATTFSRVCGMVVPGSSIAGSYSAEAFLSSPVVTVEVQRWPCR